ncbi:DNA-processing protein DprA [Calidifontibacillus oryziterrae]|uniref:DNA-processing protein DprA n=1 Tax=Calidifontibacillus oryziterrae TaxID=1191699 RepID=UPI000302F3B7|nr:DNA-processing protein DprA [Calidifontibacillus oryziterrae]
MDTLYWLWLSTIPHVGPITQKRLLEKFKSPEAIFQCSKQDLIKTKTQELRLPSTAISSIVENRNLALEKAKRILEKSKQKEIKILTFENPIYPDFAKSCPESPTVLYFKGSLNTYTHTVGIVGSRRCTKYGQKITAEIVESLAKYNIPVISGLAKGIDGYAHTAAIQNGSETLAFLANGVDKCYPTEHHKLYEKIIGNGAVLSQYPPETPALPKFFLQRNALISAWSKQLIIVEAGEKSGALTTAQFAKKYKREIYAVPNRIDVPEGWGTNALLETIAKPYLKINSLKINQRTQLAESKTTNTGTIKQKENINSIDSIEFQLEKLLNQGPLKISKICHTLQISKPELEELIFLMELHGKLKINGEFLYKR